MAGAEGFEPSARGFGGGLPHCLELTYLRCWWLCGLGEYDGYLFLPINESGFDKKMGAVYTPPLQNLQTQIFISLLLYAH